MACWGSNRSDSRGRSPRAIKLQVFYWEHLFPIFLALFDTFWLFHPKYGLLGLKSIGFSRAFTSRNKIASFCLGTPFFGTFWHFLAISPNFSPRVACDSSKWSEWVARLIFAIKSEFLWLCQTLARIWLKSDRVQKTRIWLRVVNGLLFPTVLSYHTLVSDQNWQK